MNLVVDEISDVSAPCAALAHWAAGTFGRVGTIGRDMRPAVMRDDTPAGASCPKMGTRVSAAFGRCDSSRSHGKTSWRKHPGKHPGAMHLWTITAGGLWQFDTTPPALGGRVVVCFSRCHFGG